MTTPNISVICVTQYDRHQSFKLLLEMIEAQTYYDQILEIIIVEGTQDEDDAKYNYKDLDAEVFPNYKGGFIKYCKFRPDSTLGMLRNRGNHKASGDYIIWFDDDDYYFPDRIEHSIKELQASDKLIAGCADVLIYDFQLERSFTAGVHHIGWASNGTLAYKKEYLLNNRYDDSATVGEEKAFLNNFNNPLIQLDKNKVCIISSYGNNTYNKRNIMMQAQYNIHPFVKVASFNYPISYLNRYKRIFNNEYTYYDIVYNLGFFGLKFSPDSQELGGSEQAVVQLASYFASNGYKVAVYGCCVEMDYKGVSYFSTDKFNYRAKYKNLIIWRENGLYSVLPFNVSAGNLILDLHDNVNLSKNKHIYKMYNDKFDCILFKSQYHYDQYCEAVKKIENHIIIENGVRDEFFIKSDIVKEDNTFIYASCYSRGLIEILKYVWPIIIKFIPDAKLSVCYGYQHIQQFQKDELEYLLNSKGVTDYGRIGLNEILELKHKAKYHLYPTNSPLEIDTITVKESYLTGCICILSDNPLFKYRNGCHFKLESIDDYKKMANSIVGCYLKNTTDINYMSWSEVGDKQKKLLI